MRRRIVILGHGAGVRFVVESLLRATELNYEVVAVVTHPFADHESDLKMYETRKEIYGDFAYNVFNIEKDYGIKLLESADVNDPETVQWIDQFSPAYIISIGCRNIIRKKFLNHYPGMVLNVHTTSLPKYRGAASDSWMILNGLWGTKQFGCMHFIDEGIDTGDIVAKVYYQIPEKAYPIDVFKARMSTFNEVVVAGMRNVCTPGFVAEKQIPDDAITFPRLFTPRDGKIDFHRFSGEEIMRFIYAFGYPFAGAHCFMDDKRINILQADFFDNETFHPFADGLIVGKTSRNEYKVAVRNGYLLIRKIEIDGETIEQNKIFRLGKYLK